MPFRKRRIGKWNGIYQKKLLPFAVTILWM